MRHCPNQVTNGSKRDKKRQKGTKNFRFVPKTYKKGCPNGQPCALKFIGFIRSHVVYKLFSTNSNIRVTITKDSGQQFQSQETYLDSFQRLKGCHATPKKVRNYKSLTSSIVKPVMSDIIDLEGLRDSTLVHFSTSVYYFGSMYLSL